MPAKPTFINTGPGRCATSWLFEALGAHPDITMANVKETEYFNTHFDKGEDWYERHFTDEGRRAVGEISNNYYLDPKVPSRIKEYNPNIRVMINVRDPYELLESFYAFGLRRGLKLGELSEALEIPMGRLMGSGFEHRARAHTLTTCDKATLLESVMLAQRLKPFLWELDAGRVYIFVFERMKTERAQVLKEIYRFLGVDPNFEPAGMDRVVNASIVPRSTLVARWAPKITFLLRRTGAYRALNRLHRSELIKCLLYSRPESGPSGKVDPQQKLNIETQNLINAEIEEMKQMVPCLKKWWTHRPSTVIHPPASAVFANRK